MNERRTREEEKRKKARTNPEILRNFHLALYKPPPLPPSLGPESLCYHAGKLCRLPTPPIGSSKHSTSTICPYQIHKWGPDYTSTRNSLTFVNTTAIAYGQKIGQIIMILVVCNSSCVYKRQKITSTAGLLELVETLTHLGAPCVPTTSGWIVDSHFLHKKPCSGAAGMIGLFLLSFFLSFQARW